MRTFRLFVLALLCGFYAWLLAKPINLATADLGRHLKNGELTLSSRSVPRTNVYSYTHPEHPVVNHHWGSGVIFHLVHKRAGFRGLSLFFLAISLAAFLLFFDTARRSAGFTVASILSVALIPLMASRAEIRPEAFSYLLAGLFLWILSGVRDRRLSRRWLWSLPFLEALWVNLHIYFFWGLFLAGAFALEELLSRLPRRARPARPGSWEFSPSDLRIEAFRRILSWDTKVNQLLHAHLRMTPGQIKALSADQACRALNALLPVPDLAAKASVPEPPGVPGGLAERNRRLLDTLYRDALGGAEEVAAAPPPRGFLLSLALAAAACLANPAGVGGALQPFLIFQDFGYRLFENQSVWFIERMFPAYPAGFYFKAGLALLWGGWLWVAWRRRRLFSLPALLLSAGVTALGCLAVRNFTLFAYMALPLAAINARGLLKDDSLLQSLAGFAGGVLLFVAAVLAQWDYFPDRSALGLGLSPGVDGAARFFLDRGLHGPLFNNYDAGGYLIYHLYPRERVFVDNRPEAYPAAFFRDTYQPMQEDPARWKEALGRYKFNAIFFYRHDLTPWGQNFLIQRVGDSQWSPVYVDGHCIIFLRRGGPDQAAIDKHALPREMFSVRASG